MFTYNFLKFNNNFKLNKASYATRKTLEIMQAGDRKGYCTIGSQVSRNVIPVLLRGLSTPWLWGFFNFDSLQVTNIEPITNISHSISSTILFISVRGCFHTFSGSVGNRRIFCSCGHHSIISHWLDIVIALVITVIIATAKHSVLQKQQTSVRIWIIKRNVVMEQSIFRRVNKMKELVPISSIATFILICQYIIQCGNHKWNKIVVSFYDKNIKKRWDPSISEFKCTLLKHNFYYDSFFVKDPVYLYIFNGFLITLIQRIITFVWCTRWFYK